MRLEHRLVPARDGTGGMPGQVGKLDDEAREARTGPARLVRPHRKIAKQRVDDVLGGAAKPVAKRAESGERQMMLRFEHGGQQLILALEMIVERALGDRRGRGDLVHADARIALAAKQRVGRIENALLGSARESRGIDMPPNVYRVVNLHRRGAGLEWILTRRCVGPGG